MAELQVSRLWRYGPDWLNETPMLDNADNPTEMPEDYLQELSPAARKLTIWLPLKLSTLLVRSLTVKDSAVSGDW